MTIKIKNVRLKGDPLLLLEVEDGMPEDEVDVELDELVEEVVELVLVGGVPEVGEDVLELFGIITDTLFE